MATYAVGDLQGCLQPLKCVLKQVNFNSEKDQLWLVGDLVNRGPESLDTLRFLKSLGPCVTTVLGNHDLHLLAIAHGQQTLRNKDTLKEILQAPDADDLIAWLLKKPLIHHDKQLGYAMVHAGIPPQWSLKKAKKLAKEVQLMLTSRQATKYFASMYGNEPYLWHDDLCGGERLRVITNYLTRMRFIYPDGSLDLTNKASPGKASPGTLPWFLHPTRKARKHKLIFGHWATLQGLVDQPHLYALDTGCVWGGGLTMMKLKNEKRIHCDCPAQN